MRLYKHNKPTYYVNDYFFGRYKLLLYLQSTGSGGSLRVFLQAEYAASSDRWFSAVYLNYGLS